MRSFGRDQTNAGVGQLNAFVNEVSAQSGKKIPLTIADDLIAEAEGVPLVDLVTLQRCADAAKDGAVGLVTADFEDPAELGRIRADHMVPVRPPV